VEILIHTPKVIRKILIVRKTIILLKSRVIVAIEYILVLRDRTYFFKGTYNSIENTILNYINFISIWNNIDITKTIFT
jgi:hypothetical protein